MLAFAGAHTQVTLDPSVLGIVLLPPVLRSQAVATWGTPAVVNFTVWQPAWGAAELAAVGLPTDAAWTAGVRAWLAGVPATNCSWATPTMVSCTSPPAATPQHLAVLEVAQLYNVSAVAWQAVNVSTTPSAVNWNGRLVVTSPFLGAVVPTAVFLTLDGTPATTLPCANVSTNGSDSLACVVRYIAGSWLAPGARVALQLAYGGVVSTVPPASLALTVMQPGVVAAELLTYTTPVVLMATLEQGQWTAEEVAAVAMTPGHAGLQGAVAWAGGVRTAPCVYVTAVLVRCLLPPDAPAVAPQVVVEVGGLFNVTAHAVVYNVSATRMTPDALMWGAGVTVVMPFLAQHTARLNLSADPRTGDGAYVPSLTSLPCAGGVAASQHEYGCLLRFVAASWAAPAAGTHITVRVLLTGTTRSDVVVVALPHSLSFTPPSILNVSAPDLLDRAGGSKVTFTLPQPLWTGAELAAEGLGVGPALVSAVLHMASQPAVTCPLTATPIIECVTASGVLPLLAYWLEVGGLFSASTPRLLTYAPPRLKSAEPGVLYLPTPMGIGGTLAPLVPPTATKSITFYCDSGMTEAFPHIYNLTLGGLPCASIETADDRLVCVGYNLTAVALRSMAEGPSTAQALEYVWGGMPQRLPSLFTTVIRPSISRVIPASVTTGAALLVYGTWLCAQDEAVCNNNPDDVVIMIGPVACESVTINSPSSVACIVPTVSTATPGYPTLPVVISGRFGTPSTDNVTVKYPDFVTIRVDTPLPDAYIPSDTSAPWPVATDIVFALVDAGNNPVGGVTCSLSTNQSSVQTQSLDQRALVNMAAADGVFRFGRLIVQAPFDVSGMRATFTCSRGVGDNIVPVSWDMRCIHLATFMCAAPTTVVQSQEALPSWWLAVRATSGTDAVAACRHDASGGISLPRTICTVAVAAVSANATAFVQGQTVLVDGDGFANFTGLVVTGTQNSNVSMTVACNIGATEVPGRHEFAVSIRGCQPGRQPVGVVCASCVDGQFSLGGTDKCRGCPPVGATCVGGTLSLLQGYFRPPDDAGAELGPDTELFTCYNTEACTLNASTATYGCLTGYSGPLCGVCDETEGYAMFGAACAPCPDLTFSRGLMSGVVLGFVALLAYVAVRKTSGNRSSASIVLRITLGFLQAIGALRAFKSGGTRVYNDLMGWTDAISASPMSLGPIACLTRFTFLSRYLVTVALPFLASATVIAMFVAITAAKTVRLRGPTLIDRDAVSGKVRQWLAERRHVATLIFTLHLSYMPIVSASLRALDCVGPIAGRRYLRADLAVQCGVGAHVALSVLAVLVLAVVGLGFPALVLTILVRANGATLARDQQFRSAWGFLYDGYRLDPDHVVVSLQARFSRNVTTGMVLKGARRLAVKALALPTATADGRGAPTDSSPTASPAADGSPMVTAVVAPPPHLHAPAPRRRVHLVWWEALVLLRKAGIVLIALLLVDALVQVSAAVLWLLVFAFLQERFRPYSRPLFNIIESIAMAASLFTAALCIVVAKTNDIGADVSTPRGYGVTLVMLLMNMVVVAVLTLIWVREMCVNHCYRRVGRGVARVAAARKSLHTSSRRSTHAASGIVVVTPSPSAAVISKRRVGVSAGGGSDGGGAWVGRMLSRRGAGTIPRPQVADLITNPMRVPRASVRPALSATVVAGGAGVGAVHGSGASGASDSSRNALAFAALHGYFATRGGAGATAKHVPNPAAKAAVARAAREPTPARPRSSGIRRLSDAIGSVLGRAPRLTPSGAPAGGNDSMPPVIWRGSMGVTVAAAPEPGLIPADSSTTPRAPSRRRLSGVMNPLATAAAGARREPRVSIVRSSSSGGMGSPPPHPPCRLPARGAPAWCHPPLRRPPARGAPA